MGSVGLWAYWVLGVTEFRGFALFRAWVRRTTERRQLHRGIAFSQGPCRVGEHRADDGGGMPTV